MREAARHGGRDPRLHQGERPEAQDEGRGVGAAKSAAVTPDSGPRLPRAPSSRPAPSLEPSTHQLPSRSRTHRHDAGPTGPNRLRRVRRGIRFQRLDRSSHGRRRSGIRRALGRHRDGDLLGAFAHAARAGTLIRRVLRAPFALQWSGLARLSQGSAETVRPVVVVASPPHASMLHPCSGRTMTAGPGSPVVGRLCQHSGDRSRVTRTELTHRRGNAHLRVASRGGVDGGTARRTRANGQTDCDAARRRRQRATARPRDSSVARAEGAAVQAVERAGRTRRA